jgi:hypothetical protein
MYRSIKNAEDRKLLQGDIDSEQKCCSDNGMKPNIFETTIVCFLAKLIVLILI